MKCSIIITNFNYSKYLNRAIHSALSQNFRDTEREVIVVDDASTDGSKEIIESYKHLIVPIYNKKNFGLSASRNKGMYSAEGNYIVFLDADDYFNRDLLFIESLFLDSNKFDAVSCDYYTVNNNEKVLSREYANVYPIACGIMFNKNKLEGLNGYDEKLRIHEDKELRKRWENKYGKIHNIELPLYRYRKHGDNMTNAK